MIPAQQSEDESVCEGRLPEFRRAGGEVGIEVAPDDDLNPRIHP